MSQWLVTQGDNQFAVDGLAQLKSMAEAGDLSPGDMIQPPGAADWIYATEVPQLAAIFDAGGGGADLDDFQPKGRGTTAVIAGALGLVVLLFGGAAAYMATNLPNGNEVLIGEGGLTYSQMIVTEPGQSLRKDPEDRAQMTTSLKKDEILDLMSKRGDFYRARTQSGAEGWIINTAVIPMYQLGGDDVREEYDPLYNPDRYVEVANASWQQLPPEKPKHGEEEVMITAFSFNLWNSSKYTMTDVVLRATLKDAKGSELDTIEFEIEGEIPGEKGTMVGTLKPPEDEEDGENRLLTAYTFSELSKQDPELQLRYVDGVEVELGLEEFTNAQIDIVELRAIPDKEAAKNVRD